MVSGSLELFGAAPEQRESLQPYRDTHERSRGILGGTGHDRELADDVGGWKGRKIWDSEFGELPLDCANDRGGLIERVVRMQGLWPMSPTEAACYS